MLFRKGKPTRLALWALPEGLFYLTLSISVKNQQGEECYDIMVIISYVTHLVGNVHKIACRFVAAVRFIF